MLAVLTITPSAAAPGSSAALQAAFASIFSISATVKALKVVERTLPLLLRWRRRYA